MPLRTEVSRSEAPRVLDTNHYAVRCPRLSQAKRGKWFGRVWWSLAGRRRGTHPTVHCGAQNALVPVLTGSAEWRGLNLGREIGEGEALDDVMSLMGVTGCAD